MTRDSDQKIIPPDEYAMTFQWDLEAFDGSRARSVQTDAGTIGVSDLHTCREKVRRTLLGHVPTDVPEKWAAIVGTYVDEGVKAARKAARPWLLHDVALTVTLPNGLIVPGNADEIDPTEPSVTDVKTKAELAAIRRMGADEQQRAQRHLYYLGAMQAGIVGPHGVVRNIFLDRSGSDPNPHVEQEPFDMNVVLVAQSWLEDAVYAAEHGEEGMKDWPRNMCERWCQFYTVCRGSEKIEEEYLTGDSARKVAEFFDARTTRIEAEKREAALRKELLGTTGRSDTHWVRSTVTNGKTGSVRLDAGKVA